MRSIRFRLLPRKVPRFFSLLAAWCFVFTDLQLDALESPSKSHSSSSRENENRIVESSLLFVSGEDGNSLNVTRSPSNSANVSFFAQNHISVKEESGNASRKESQSCHHGYAHAGIASIGFMALRSEVAVPVVSAAILEADTSYSAMRTLRTDLELARTILEVVRKRERVKHKLFASRRRSLHCEVRDMLNSGSPFPKTQYSSLFNDSGVFRYNGIGIPVR